MRSLRILHLEAGKCQKDNQECQNSATEKASQKMGKCQDSNYRVWRIARKWYWSVEVRNEWPGGMI